MKIYFAGSIRGGRQDQEIYYEIVKELGKYGKVLTEHVADKNVSSYGDNLLDNSFIFNRDMNWMKESDIIVAEVTVPSLGVGYELGQAQAIGKKIICLYRKEDESGLSSMITGNKYIKIFQYKELKDLFGFFAKEFS